MKMTFLQKMFNDKILAIAIFTQFLVCANNLVEFTENDDATWSRVRIIIFRTNCVDFKSKEEEKNTTDKKR